MANFIANNWLLLLLNGGVDMDTDTLKLILCSESFDGTDEDDNLGDITTLDELSATNYAGGHGGAGRKTLANVAATVDDANNRADLDADDAVYTSLGGASNDVIEWIGIHKPGTSSDADAKVCGFTDKTGSTLTTNGGNVTVTIADFFRLGREAGS